MNYDYIRAAVTKFYRLGGLSYRNLFSHGSGGWKSQVKMSAGLVSSLLGLWVAALLLPLHLVIPQYLCDPDISLGTLISSSCKKLLDWIRTHSNSPI